MNKSKIDSYASVWDAISDTPEEAANLRLRSELLEKITALIQAKCWMHLLTLPRILVSGCMLSWKLLEEHQKSYFYLFSGVK